MIEIEINEKNLLNFLKNIRNSDKEELDIILKNNIKSKFIEICTQNKKTYLIADINKNPIAIGGVGDYLHQSEPIGQIWLLCTNIAQNNKLNLYKYLKFRLNYFEKEYNFLFNYIYKSNYSSLNLLKKFKFEVIDTPNKDFKLFYKQTGDKIIDTRYFTCQ